MIYITNKKEVGFTMTLLTPPRSKNWYHHLRLKIWVPALLLILAVCLTLKTTYYATEHYLDGDASSELVLAHHLAETGQILSTDWYYSTELRVLNTQLVYAPLFRIFSDWHMVRFVGALIMQALLVLSFAYLCKQTSLSLGAFFLGAALLISPTSIAYGRIVLYHCYYMPHIILSFLIVGLYLSSYKKFTIRRYGPASLRCLLLLLLSFGSGLGGVRQVIITHLPLLLVVVYRIFREGPQTPLWIAIKNNLGKLSLGCLCTFAFLIGFVINTSVFHRLFEFKDYTQLVYEIIDTQKLSDLIYGLLHQFGFRRQLKILSRSGLITLGSIIIAAYCIGSSIHRCIKNTDHPCFSKQIVSLFFSSALCVMLCVFILADSEWQYVLYLIPVAVWYIPLLCIQYDSFSIHSLYVRHSDTHLLLTLLLLIPSIAVNVLFFNAHNTSFSQLYEGLTYKNENLVQQLQQPLKSIQENSYTIGYSTFWNGNTITEITDGQIKMIGLELKEGKDANDTESALPSFSYYKWLTLKSYHDLDPEKVFLLLTSAENEAYLEMPFEDKGEVIYEDDGCFIVYGFDDPSMIYQMIIW